MNNLHGTNELELGRFGEYLLKTRIVPKKYARHYVAWVRKFLVHIPERSGVALENRIGFSSQPAPPGRRLAARSGREGGATVAPSDSGAVRPSIMKADRDVILAPHRGPVGEEVLSVAAVLRLPPRRIRVGAGLI
jgi:hypothetical protein